MIKKQIAILVYDDKTQAITSVVLTDENTRKHTHYSIEEKTFDEVFTLLEELNQK